VTAALLTPGAGADRNQAALVAIDEVLTALGVAVERMDFPYRKAGRRAQDKPAVLIQSIVDAAGALGACDVILGGRSMGGRMCSMAVAQGLVPAAKALVLVSYPLHPPGRPEKQPERTAHFPHLALPCLFVSGTKDAFGTPEELTEAATAIPGPVTHVWVHGGDHGLRRKDAEVAEAVGGWASEILR